MGRVVQVNEMNAPQGVKNIMYFPFNLIFQEPKGREGALAEWKY